MHTPYPITPYHRPSQAMHAIPSPKIGRRISLIALQEELQLPTRHGLVGTRSLKILRIEQVCRAARRVDDAALAAARAGPVSAQLAAAPRRTLPPPQPEPPELEGWLDGQRVHLRGVGEAMTDEAGNFYEVLGQQLRPLGELVSDEQGRIFEVQPSASRRNRPRQSNREQAQVNLNKAGFLPPHTMVITLKHHRGQPARKSFKQSHHPLIAPSSPTQGCT